MDRAWVQMRYRPEGARPTLPALSGQSSLAEYLRHAMLAHPQVEAAYFDWYASVENITVARSLPDPQLTFQADIMDVVTSVMPGLTQSFPGPGKLRAAGNASAEAGRGKYFAFETAVLQSAFALKKSYYRLWFLDEKIRVDGEMLQLLAELERIARSKNESGQATLQDVYRAQIEEDRLATEVAGLEDSRSLLRAEFKAALGLTREQPDPPMPERFEATTLDLTPEQVLDSAFARNPQLKAMAAEVRSAEALLQLAYRAKVPDTSLGLMADAKMAPILYRPLAGLTLPIWRDKLAAQIAAAQANKFAAQARMSLEQINLILVFAEKSFDGRENSRTLALLREKLLPKARQSLELARSAYLSGKTDFFNLIDAERTLLDFRLSEISARSEREMILSELGLLIAGVPPETAPLLDSRSSPQPAPGRSTP
jgi:outer membrane protein TolC